MFSPNITGEFAQNYQGRESGGWHIANGSILYGVFDKGRKVNCSCSWQYFGDDYSLLFNANKASGLFGKSSTVQTASVRVLTLIGTEMEKWGKQSHMAQIFQMAH